MDKWRIVYYQSLSSERIPVKDFVESLEAKAKYKVVYTLNLLAEFGLQIGPNRAQKLAGTNLWELRILGQDNIRIFYVAVVDKTFLLLHGFVKKKQKTDIKEIKVAKARLQEYLSR